MTDNRPCRTGKAVVRVRHIVPPEPVRHKIRPPTRWLKTTRVAEAILIHVSNPCGQNSYMNFLVELKPETGRDFVIPVVARSVQKKIGTDIRRHSECVIPHRKNHCPLFRITLGHEVTRLVCTQIAASRRQFSR